MELEFRTLAKRLFGKDYELGDDVESEADKEEPATIGEHRYHLVNPTKALILLSACPNRNRFV